MQREKARVFKLAGTILAVSSPFLTHIVLTYSSLVGAKLNAVGYALILIQSALSCSLVIAFVDVRYRWAAISGIMVCGVVLCAFHLSSGLALSSGLPHAVIYLGLLILFGASLMPGQEPIVTFFAHTIHGALATAVENYTRHVTYAWCVFFAGQLLGSAILIVFAPLTWWSAFVNLLNIPLVILMFLGERLTRGFWVPDPPHEYLADMMKVAGLVTGKLAKRDHRQ